MKSIHRKQIGLPSETDCEQMQQRLNEYIEEAEQEGLELRFYPAMKLESYDCLTDALADRGVGDVDCAEIAQLALENDVSVIRIPRDEDSYENELVHIEPNGTAHVYETYPEMLFDTLSEVEASADDIIAELDITGEWAIFVRTEPDGGWD